MVEFSGYFFALSFQGVGREFYWRRNFNFKIIY